MFMLWTCTSQRAVASQEHARQLKEHKFTEQNPNLFQGFKGFYNLTPNYLFKHFLA